MDNPLKLPKNLHRALISCPNYAELIFILFLCVLYILLFIVQYVCTPLDIDFSVFT